MANEFVVRNGLRVPSIPNGCYLSSVNGTIVGCTVPAPIIVPGTGTNSTLRCGVNSTASGTYSTVLGCCSISRGFSSIVIGIDSHIGGYQGGQGVTNCCANFSGILSGQSNVIFAAYTGQCLASSNHSLIGGGYGNGIAVGQSCSVLVGGWFNNIEGFSDTSQGCQLGQSFVGGGSFNSVYSCQGSIVGGTGNQISGGNTAPINPTCWSFIGGGLYNFIERCYGTIAGGGCNYVYANAGTIAGGFCNIVCCNTGFIGGGRNSTMSGRYATLGGGRNHTISGYGADVLGGCLHTASSSWTSIGGGINNTASADFATISGGFRAVADKYAQRSHASGRFAVNGDSQQVDLVGRTKTTNNTPTNIWLDGTSVRITIASGKALFAVVNVAGIKSDGSAAAHYIRKVAIKNVGGTTSLIGTVSTIGTDVEDNVNYDVTITADDTTDSLDIKVTGETAETLRWTSHIEGVEIAYGT